MYVEGGKISSVFWKALIDEADMLVTSPFDSLLELSSLLRKFRTKRQALIIGKTNMEDKKVLTAQRCILKTSNIL